MSVAPETQRKLGDLDMTRYAIIGILGLIFAIVAPGRAFAGKKVATTHFEIRISEAVVADGVAVLDKKGKPVFDETYVLATEKIPAGFEGVDRRELHTGVDAEGTWQADITVEEKKSTQGLADMIQANTASRHALLKAIIPDSLSAIVKLAETYFKFGLPAAAAEVTEEEQTGLEKLRDLLNEAPNARGGE